MPRLKRTSPKLTSPLDTPRSLIVSSPISAFVPYDPSLCPSHRLVNTDARGQMSIFSVSERIPVYNQLTFPDMLHTLFHVNLLYGNHVIILYFKPLAGHILKYEPCTCFGRKMVRCFYLNNSLHETNSTFISRGAPHTGW